MNLLQIGNTEWPRWMVYHDIRARYWSKGRWVKRRRNGEVWHKRSDAEVARQEAILFSDGMGVEDE